MTPAFCHSSHVGLKGSSARAQISPSSIVGLDAMPHAGHGGSSVLAGCPVAAKVTQTSWIQRASSRLSGETGPMTLATPGAVNVPNTNGISKVWAAPKKPSLTGERHSNRYVHVGAPHVERA